MNESYMNKWIIEENQWIINWLNYVTKKTNELMVK